MRAGRNHPAYSLAAQRFPAPFVDQTSTWYEPFLQSDLSTVDEGTTVAGSQQYPQAFLPNSHSDNLLFDPRTSDFDGSQQLSSASDTWLSEASHAGMGDTYAVSNTISPQQEAQPAALLPAEFSKDISSTEIDWSLDYGKDAIDFYNEKLPATQITYQTALGLESSSAN